MRPITATYALFAMIFIGTVLANGTANASCDWDGGHKSTGQTSVLTTYTLSGGTNTCTIARRPCKTCYLKSVSILKKPTNGTLEQVSPVKLNYTMMRGAKDHFLLIWCEVQGTAETCFNNNVDIIRQ